MSGAIMPAPLAMPLIVTVDAAELDACAVATFGKVSVVMIARAASNQGSPAAAGCAMSPSTPANFGRRRAARRSRRSRRGRPPLGGSRRLRPPTSPVSAVALAALRPVKALALPELTTQRPRLPPAQIGAAEIDRGRGAFRAGEDAGDRRAGWSNDHQQHVGAVLVFDAGLGGGDAHAARSPASSGRSSARAAKRSGHDVGTCNGDGAPDTPGLLDGLACSCHRRRRRRSLLPRLLAAVSASARPSVFSAGIGDLDLGRGLAAT